MFYRNSNSPKAGAALRDRRSEEKMKTSCGALSLLLTVAILPIIIHAAYFYTTDKVAAANISCDEEYQTSLTWCALLCSGMNCYRFRVMNGVCKITRRKLSQQSAKREVFYRKVFFHASICHNYIYTHIDCNLCH